MRTLLALGDSVTEGFQSFAVSAACQRRAFPAIMAESNPGRIAQPKLPYVEDPGFPLNLEALLNSLDIFLSSGNFPSTLQEVSRFITHRAVRSYPIPDVQNNNLAIYGFTASDVLEATYVNRTPLLYRAIIRFENSFPDIAFWARVRGGLTDKKLQLGTRPAIETVRKVSSFNLARITHHTLCGNKRDKDHSQVDIACRALAALRQERSEGLVTLWAGNNDILGALLTADARYIDEPSRVAAALRTSLTRLLAEPNARVVVGTLPDVSALPFVNHGTLRPVFPVYPELSRQVYDDIRAAITETNRLIFALAEELDNPRLSVFDAGRVFSGMVETGLDVDVAGKKMHLTADMPEIDADGRLIRGGLFSLDGIHPSSTGQAIVAKGMLDAFRSQGLSDLEDPDFNECAMRDTLVVSPPRLLTRFYDTTSDIYALCDKLGLFPLIRTLLLEQFGMHRFR